MSKELASFDLTTNEGMIKAFNGKNATDGALKELLGKRVTLEDVLIHTDSRADEETGELIESTVTVLFTNEGVFGGNSSVLNKTAEGIIGILQQVGAMDIEVFESTSNNGRKFLNLKLV